MCEYYNRQYGTNFIACMPTNLYGPQDNFDPLKSHVIPALIRKFWQAKRDGKEEVVVWGSGKPYREFLYIDELAEACLFLMKNYDYDEIGKFVNIGTGNDLKIKELAKLIKGIVEFKGKINWDISKPDGTLKKQLDIGKMKELGWKPKISLRDGIEMVYKWYLDKDNKK